MEEMPWNYHNEYENEKCVNLNYWCVASAKCTDRCEKCNRIFF